MNERDSLLSRLLNHWFTCAVLTIVLLMLSGMCLLTTPISDLVGLIRRQVGWVWNVGLWSFNVMNASFLYNVSIRSSSFSCCAIFAALVSIVLTALSFDFFVRSCGHGVIICGFVYWEAVGFLNVVLDVVVQFTLEMAFSIFELNVLN